MHRVVRRLSAVVPRNATFPTSLSPSGGVTGGRYRPAVALAVGFAPHSGWAIAVVLDGRTVVDRRRIDIAPTSVDRQVFHAAEGCRDAHAIVEAGVREAHEAAVRAIAGFDVATAGVVGLPRDLPDLDRILANHMLLHSAEGDLYRATLAEACAARGWPVTQALAKDLKAEAESWKGAEKPPWQADHRLAAAVALRSVGA